MLGGPLHTHGRTVYDRCHKGTGVGAIMRAGAPDNFYIGTHAAPVRQPLPRKTPSTLPVIHTRKGSHKPTLMAQQSGPEQYSNTSRPCAQGLIFTPLRAIFYSTAPLLRAKIQTVQRRYRAMKCEHCPQRVQPEWKYCPACGQQITVRTEERLSSSGVKYFPDAFEEAPYKCGRAVAETAEFYEVFLRFILATVEDPTMLVHFRPQIVNEVQRQAGSKGVPKVELCWCALSLASEKYFADKARAYDWSPSEEEEVKSGWLEMLAMAFVPREGVSRSLDIKVIRSWVQLFRQLHERESGPLPACSPCKSKCLYQCEVAEVTQSARVRSDYQASVSRQNTTAAESAASYCRLLSERMIGKHNKDLSYCLAVHLIRDLEVSPRERRVLSSDAQLIMSRKSACFS